MNQSEVKALVMGVKNENQSIVDGDGRTPANSLAPRIVSGSVGSFITALAVTPLEVVKIRQQASLPRDSTHKLASKPETKTLLKGYRTVMLKNEVQLPKSSFPCLVAPGHTESMAQSAPKIRVSSKCYESTLCTTGLSTIKETPGPQESTLRMLKSILRSEGLTGLYTGLRPTLLMTIPNTALTLTLYDEIMHHTLPTQTVSQVYVPLIAGAFSRCVSSTVTLPLELIRTRQASFMSSTGGSIGSVPGLVEDFRYLVRTHGVAGLYAGLPVTLVRDGSFSGIYFLCLEKFRNGLKEFHGFGGGNYYRQNGMSIPQSVSIAHNLISGAAAASIATLLTGLLDTAKTRRQMIRKVGSGQECTDQSMYGLIKNIYKHEGIAGLWKGNNARMTKVVPASAIMIACYEVGKDIIRDLFSD